jgi:hypothetical protein
VQMSRGFAVSGAMAGRPASPVGVAGPLLGLATAVAFIACLLIGARGPTLACAIVTIAAPGAIALRRFRQYGLLDALGLFCFAFVAYNGLMLLRFMTMADLTDIPYPWPFSQEAFAHAGLLDAIAAVTIFVTASILTRVWPSPKVSDVRPHAPVRRYSSWFIAGLLMYLAGIVMYFLQYDQLGGYLAALKVGRVNRFGLLSTGSAGLSWPYIAFVLCGLAAMWFAYVEQKTPFRKWAAWSALVVWCGLLLPQGDRLVPLEAVFAVLAVVFTCRRLKLALNVKTVSIFVAAYLVLAVFGHLRAVIAPITGGEMTNQEAQVFVQSNSMLDWAKPEHSELAGPYFSLLQVISNPSQDLLVENSYVSSLPTLLPKAMYPGIKPIELALRFSASVYTGHGAAPGWGFSPVAEAYLNFGTAGVVFIFMMWTVFFFTLDHLKHFYPIGMLLFSVLLLETVDANRIDFRNVYGVTAYFTLAILLTTALSKLFLVTAGSRAAGRPGTI